ncbi:MAG TPA: LuxR C-terminal-related transcriptional regulator [Thermoleophilaceae bacterium]|nr:LuxR C-terminal-related transcriptional regulator [Thermoleophilaceae bacterium]
MTDRESERRRLLERAEEAAQSGSWEWDVETGRLIWSDNLYRLFGLEPGGITPTPEYVLERTHPDDRDRVEQALGDARTDRRIQVLEYRIIRADGAVRHLRALQAVVAESAGRRPKLVGSLQDLTDLRHASRQVAVHVAVAESLERWQTFEQGVSDLLRNLAEALECLAGALWLPQDDVLILRGFWQSRSADAAEIESEVSGERVRRGAGLPGLAWDSKAVQTRANDLTEGGAVDSPFIGFVAIPVLHHDEVLAVLEFYCRLEGDADAGDLLVRSLSGIAYELGEFLGHRQGELSPAVLTPRELEVLQLAAGGRTGPQIAEELFVSPSTIQSHLKNIYGKYGVSDRASAVAKALREGLIE